MNRLPVDPEKRRAAMTQRTAWLERMKGLDARHAALYCPVHVNYIGANGVFPCADCQEPEAR